jgi:transposase
VDRQEAERLYDAGKQPTVEKLLEYDKENAELKEKIAGLERNSSSSSKPPSSDSILDRKQRKRSNKKRNGRKPGGQPGHKGKKRQLVPVEQVDEVIPCYPSECQVCRHFSTCRKRHVVGQPFRWQVTEIPPLRPTVIEYQVYTLSGRCGKTHRADPPAEVARSNFGARLTALIAYFTAVLHMPRRVVKDCLQTVFGVTLALGSTQNLLEHTSHALKPIDEQLKDALPAQAVLNADESGWYRRWVWIFVTKGFIYFHIAASRGSSVLKQVLGEVYRGILGADRWGAYTKYHKEGILQLCWEHLKRDIRGIGEIGKKTELKEARAFARRMEYLRMKLMAMWYRFKDRELTREQLMEQSKPLRYRIEKCLRDHRDSSVRKVRVFARRLYKLRSHLFTFISYEDVEPTNNSAERGIRSAVLWRKICFGNKSEEGAILTGRLLTVTRTCWLQKRNALQFLVEAISAYRRAAPAPSLLV